MNTYASVKNVTEIVLPSDIPNTMLAECLPFVASGFLLDGFVRFRNAS